MDYPAPSPLIPSFVVGSGILGLAIFIGLVVAAFVASAFIASLWVRLVITFMRKTLDREYGRLRTAGSSFEAGKAVRPARPSAPMPLRPDQGPRDW